ncbi:hypothetical protein ON010_g16309 [Phytophthora cinnamomi]|nr:hypothetical protein ON010_g16309 [Phytophthora cinnamomi]
MTGAFHDYGTGYGTVSSFLLQQFELSSRPAFELWAKSYRRPSGAWLECISDFAHVSRQASWFNMPLTSDTMGSTGLRSMIHWRRARTKLESDTRTFDNAIGKANSSTALALIVCDFRGWHSVVLRGGRLRHAAAVNGHLAKPLCEQRFFLMRKPRHRNSTRDREKAELATLRGLVPELEAHIGVLRRGEQYQRSSSAWRCFSERQARARQTAEHANRVLNDRVQNNADWIQRLWELLHEKRRAAEAPAQLAQAAVQQLPVVFAANCVPLVTGPLERDLWSRVQTGNFRSMLVCARRVPFDMHSTSAAIWTTLSCPDRSFASEETSGHDVTPIARVLEQSPVVCSMKFQGTIREESGELTPLNYHAVVHRTEMTELHSANAFVWQPSFKLAGRGIKHRDTMWVAVTRSPSGGLESTVSVVCQSQVETRARVDDARNLLVSIMAATDVCVESILSSADTILFEESSSGSSRQSRNVNTLMQTIDV